MPNEVDTMKKTTVLFLALLVLTVFVSGCVGKGPAETGTGNSAQITDSIPDAGASGMTVETPEASADENVDLGSLI